MVKKQRRLIKSSAFLEQCEREIPIGVDEWDEWDVFDAFHELKIDAVTFPYLKQTRVTMLHLDLQCETKKNMKISEHRKLQDVA